jgi:hypothetical protein
MATVKNKRRFLRTKAQNLVAHLRVGDKQIMAPVEDISLGGMLARTAESLPIGTAVMFDLARPGLKKPLRLLGVVVDTRVGRGLGIRFDGLDKDTAARLEDLIADLGGFTHSLLVDKPDPDPRPAPAAPPPVVSPPNPFATPTTTSTTLQQPPSGAFRAPPGLAQPVTPAPDADKLQQQMRSLVMELGRAQEALTQKEKELHDVRGDLDRLRAELAAGDAAQRLVGRLEIEKRRLEDELAASRQRAAVDVDAIYREAEAAAQALARLVETLRHMR